jgi:DNA-damage-inducible protein J
MTMGSNALVQTRIDADIRDRAATVLESMGLTVSDAVRILLTRTANEGALPLELISTSEAHDSWFRAKVIEVLKDPRPGIPDDGVASHFARMRGRARGKSKPKP